jgi:hypothetical protein
MWTGAKFTGSSRGKDEFRMQKAEFGSPKGKKTPGYTPPL